MSHVKIFHTQYKNKSYEKIEQEITKLKDVNEDNKINNLKILLRNFNIKFIIFSLS